MGIRVPGLVMQSQEPPWWFSCIQMWGYSQRVEVLSCLDDQLVPPPSDGGRDTDVSDRRKWITDITVSSSCEGVCFGMCTLIVQAEAWWKTGNVWVWGIWLWYSASVNGQRIQPNLRTMEWDGDKCAFASRLAWHSTLLLGCRAREHDGQETSKSIIVWHLGPFPKLLAWVILLFRRHLQYDDSQCPPQKRTPTSTK